jgi:hypothetical protein
MANANKETGNKPVKRIQIRGITASVFRNTTDNGAAFYKVSLSRTFKDGDEFKSTTSFSRDDLPIVAELSHQAWLAIIELEAAKS